MKSRQSPPPGPDKVAVVRCGKCNKVLTELASGATVSRATLPSCDCGSADNEGPSTFTATATQGNDLRDVLRGLDDG